MREFDFKCPNCQVVSERLIEKDGETQECHICGTFMDRQFPVEAIKGFQPFESYYDEALDCDVHGKREKAEILRNEGLIERGDKVRGARNEDKQANMIKPQPVVGKRYQDLQRKDAWLEKNSPEMDVTSIGQETDSD